MVKIVCVSMSAASLAVYSTDACPSFWAAGACPSARLTCCSCRAKAVAIVALGAIAKQSLPSASRCGRGLPSYYAQIKLYDELSQVGEFVWAAPFC